MCDCEKIPTYWTASASYISEPAPRDLMVQLLDKLREDIHEGWSETWYQCKKCQTHYLLTEDIGYHYPTYTFTKA